jgi:hypothetical protein
MVLVDYLCTQYDLNIKWLPSFDGKCVLSAYINTFLKSKHVAPMWKCVHVSESNAIFGKIIFT